MMSTDLHPEIKASDLPQQELQKISPDRVEGLQDSPERNSLIIHLIQSHSPARLMKVLPVL